VKFSENSARLSLYRLLVRFLPAALVLLLVACDAREGDSCAGSAGECTSGTEALACVGGTMRRLPCRGEGGCRPAGDGVRCDQSLAQEGDACFGGVACTADMRSFLVCEDARFVRAADCPTGCTRSGDRATCAHPELQPPLE
jgi:hypothetical protein